MQSIYGSYGPDYHHKTTAFYHFVVSNYDLGCDVTTHAGFILFHFIVIVHYPNYYPFISL